MAEKTPSIGLLSPLIWAAIAGVAVTAAYLLAFSPAPGRSSSVGEMPSLAQNIALNSAAAVGGDPVAFDALASERGQLAELAGKEGAQIQDGASLQKMLGASKLVLDNREATLAAHDTARSAANVVPQLLQGLGNIVGSFGAARVESMSKQVERFEQTGQRLIRDLNAVADGIGDVQSTARRAAESSDYMGQVFGELGGEEAGLGLARVTGVDTEQKLKTLTATYRKLAEQVRATAAAAEKVGAAHQASLEVLASHKALLPSLAPASVNAAASAPIPFIPLAILGVVLFVLFGLLQVNKAAHHISREMRKQAEQNERNQQAILRLLDELSNLADGDLTVQATVTEDITGAIADSINYAIEALRELVATINRTAITLDSGAKQTLAAAGHLAKASVTQSKQVAAASESAGAMANSVEEVSGNAERSSDVARHAVDISHKGGEAVRRTIDGMNAIRETIQETSKRIKRLGESSQEIGNIVELINDIAEQTNILALNASIQASMAGEAGRGFAVVADEVQRLAERAATATKQIEVLVRTIQADTNEAVVSMERSTTDVVGGALLAENAGAALEEIEQVSNQIASLVQNISASARHQTGSAQDIARNMQVLREISAQTAENSAATTNSIGKLAQLSTSLRKSVSGFRLPESAAAAAAPAPDPTPAADRPASKAASRPVGRMTA
ncbi:MAG TPA: methyl-accepting chemotaxis protein [Steroidobacteraceae bacterium]|nr:methyl-accepting chemotaxis protein [Steroidobacteraceae bacterium]